MVKNFLDRIALRTRMGFFAAFFLLALSYLLTFISTRKVAKQDYWMSHTNEVIHSLDNILGFITKCESSYRGYLISHDAGEMKNYHESLKDTDSAFAQLKRLTTDNLPQQQNLDTLRYLIDQEFSNIGHLLSEENVFIKGHPGASRLVNSDTVLKSGYIKAHLFKMKEEEKRLWNERSESASRYADLIKVLNTTSIIIAILLSCYSLIVYNKENHERKKASVKAEEYKEQLQKRIRELGELNRELIELRSLEKYTVTGRIARVIAHEVRNPLTNINLATEQLHAEVPHTETTGMLLGMINRNSERINQLVSDLLNATRVSKLDFSSLSINAVLDDALDLAKDRIKLNEIHLIKDYDSSICPIQVDREKMKIAFLNIIVNAIEAMDRKGTLTITTKAVEKKCIVEIKDNGKGMKKSEVDRLFEPYFTTKEKGNGLGLANSQNIILAHEGSISAESELQKGTVFTITFPMR